MFGRRYKTGYVKGDQDRVGFRDLYDVVDMGDPEETRRGVGHHEADE